MGHFIQKRWNFIGSDAVEDREAAFLALVELLVIVNEELTVNVPDRIIERFVIAVYCSEIVIITLAAAFPSLTNDIVNFLL